MTRDSNPPEKALPDLLRSHGGPLVLRYRKPILFFTLALCMAGWYAAQTMPASVFPHTDFPRVVVLIDNGVMPADQMMAAITRPVEEAMKDIPGTINIRSSTGRGSAEVNVFFDWSTDMVESELYVLGRLSQIRGRLPNTATFAVHRLTFSAFPIIGISLTSQQRDITELWEKARYDISPQLLRIRGVARVGIVGGREPEFHVVVDLAKLESKRLTVDQISQALAATNQFTPAGLHEENHQLYLSVVDNRIRQPAALGDVVVAWSGGSPITIRDIAAVRRGAAPQFNIVTADGTEAVLMNVYSQPNGNTLGIADALEEELQSARSQLPADMKLAFFYDQSLFLREGMQSVWEAILIGLLLSALVLFVFLGSLATTVAAAVVIPVSVLMTMLGMRAFGMSFDIMTLGGIAAAIGLVIDDAIVTVEAIHAKVQAGHTPNEAVGLAIREVGLPLVGSTLTPVVVFLPLAFLTGVAGVFFRALALTMVFAVLSSLLLAVTWTPVLGSLLIRRRVGVSQDELEQGGPILRKLVRLYEIVVRYALRFSGTTAIGLLLFVAAGTMLYWRLNTEFLPEQDEGAFVLDYFSRPGTSLSETDRMLRHVERLLAKTPEVESYSRRTGARLALAITEPNTGDFLVKLKPDRQLSTSEVIDKLRQEIHQAEPALHTEFPLVLGDLIGDLTWSPNPVEIKIFSTDINVLKTKAAEIAEAIQTIPGVVDVNNGLVVAGPTERFRVRLAAAARAGLTPKQIGSLIQTAMYGKVSSSILQGDRLYGVRVLATPRSYQQEQDISEIPIRSASGAVLTLSDVASIHHDPGILEMHREDLRQLVAVSARFSGVDLGHGIRAIQRKLAKTVSLPPGTTIEYGGLYRQQQESFRNLALVLSMAIVLVYGVLLLEFRSVLAPLAIVMGAALALLGVVAALWMTGTSFNIVSFLGTIIGVGIVAKNGILMLDFVDHLRARGLTLIEALVQSGRRRLRPVLMTSLTTLLGLLPLAYGLGAGADMLKPLAIAVIGAVVTSVLLSLIATPVCYYLLMRLFRQDQSPRSPSGQTASAGDSR